MIALLKDFKIGIDSETTRFMVSLNFGGVKIVFQAKKDMLLGLVRTINQAIEQSDALGWDDDNEQQ